jgi:hypothetical protein
MRFILLFLAILCLPFNAVAQQKVPRSSNYDVYFVAIGSSYYAKPASTTAQGLHRLRGANISARLVADRLLRGGAHFGITLTSADNAFVTTDDIRDAIGRAATVIRANRPAAPLLVFYFAGHGITEGFAWNHFSLPGDFTYEGALASLDMETLSRRTLHAAALNDELDKLAIPYLVLLDTCYEGTEANFESPVLTGTAIQNIRSIAAVLRVMNEFRQENPVLFSTVPGTVVPTVPDPTNSGPDSIGPLARRAIMIFDNAERGKKDIDLGAFIRQMTDPGLDVATKPAVTAAQAAPSWSRLLARATAQAGKLEERQGSATDPAEPCCAPVEVALPPSQRMTGRIELAGGPGEYIMDGQTVVITGTEGIITAALDGVGDVTITASKGDETWELAFSMPRGAHLKRGRYTRAERHNFASDGRAGVSVTGSGRGCNKVTGEATITDAVQTANGKLSRLSMIIKQRCDDNPAVLQAIVDLREP